MIMPAGRQLLMPANPRFIALTLVMGLLMNMLLGLTGWRWLPDILAIKNSWEGPHAQHGSPKPSAAAQPLPSA